MNVRLFTIVIVSCFYSCQIMENKLSDNERDNIIKEIKQTTDSVYAAGSMRDYDRVYTFFSDSTTGAWNGLIIESWETQKKHGRAFIAQQEKVNYSVDTMSVDVLSPDVAVVVGKYKMIATDTSGKTITVNPAWTYVFNKQDGKWKIVHFHISEFIPPTYEQR